MNLALGHKSELAEFINSHVLHTEKDFSLRLRCIYVNKTTEKRISVNRQRLPKTRAYVMKNKPFNRKSKPLIWLN